MNAEFQVHDYNLAATLVSGQAFRWKFRVNGWEGVIDSRWVRLRQNKNEIIAETATSERGCVVLDQPQRVAISNRARVNPPPAHGEAAAVGRGRHSRAPVASVSDWKWLTDYLQLDVDLPDIISTFPDDKPMRVAIESCRGLRLLRQEPWECLASFILSSTKQIVQIQQIVALLCERFGELVAVPIGHEPAFGFPTFARIAQTTEAELRACKMGFRAPYLLKTAKMLVNKEIVLENLHRCSVEEARGELLKLPGVGLKIADCVLLFAYGFQSAFPLDVWIMKALRELYFPKRRVKMDRLRRFSQEHFGPNAGYAQQYLFHYMRTRI